MTGGKNQLRPLTPIELPAVLYHGSAYRAEELKPGFYHQGCLRTWGQHGSRNKGGLESNHYLYATSDLRAATDYALYNALTCAPWKLLELYQGERSLVLRFDERVTIEQLTSLQAWVYTLEPQASQCWIRNQELPEPELLQEFRTRRVIKPSQVQAIDVRAWLRSRHAVISCPTTVAV